MCDLGSTLTNLGRGGHDDGDIEGTAELGVSVHVVPVKGGIEVPGELEETDLEIEDDQQL